MKCQLYQKLCLYAQNSLRISYGHYLNLILASGANVKTFYGRFLRTFVLCQSVCPRQTLPVWINRARHSSLV